MQEEVAKRLLELMELKDLNMTKLARLAAVPPSTVKSIVYGASKKIRELLPLNYYVTQWTSLSLNFLIQIHSAHLKRKRSNKTNGAKSKCRFSFAAYLSNFL